MIGFFNISVIPTYISLVSAVIGIFFAISGTPDRAMICLIFSGFCDTIDGMIARRLIRTEQERSFGIQLDSLADLVAFGTLPAVIGYTLGLTRPQHVAVFALFVLCALIRLAYFNVTEEERQKTTSERRSHYEGLPVTSDAFILPALFCFSRLLGDAFGIIYCCFMAAIAVLFVIRFRVPKPSALGKLILAVLGVVVLAVLFIQF